MVEDTDNNSLGSSGNQRFLRLFLASRSQINGFILFLVPNSLDAEEVFQETAAVMWEKFHDYEEGTNFTAWAKKIALYKVMEFRRRESRKTLHFDHEVLEKIVEASEGVLEQQQEQRNALRKCIEKLCEPDRSLVRVRYEQGLPISIMARDMKKSVHTLYRKISKIHEVLRRCVKRYLVAEGEIG